MSTLQTNIIGTSNLLNIIRSSKNLKSVVIITSDKCYENISKKTYVETDKLGGSDIYSASKSSCELVVSAFRKSFFLDKKINIATARAGNVIGGGDYSQHRIIPDIIKSFEKKKELYNKKSKSYKTMATCFRSNKWVFKVSRKII